MRIIEMKRTQEDRFKKPIYCYGDCAVNIIISWNIKINSPVLSLSPKSSKTELFSKKKELYF